MGCFTLKTRHLTQSVYVGGCELHPFVVGGRGEEVFGIVNRRCLPRSIVVHVISFIQYFKLLAFTLCSGSIGFWN
jgi:hypothetical protein